MDDLISRTWLLAEYDKRHKGPPGGARKLIEEAPSALGTDCISRQAAIDDIWTVSPLARLDRKWVDRWLRQLPSAQPEPSQVARDIARIVENEKDMRVIAQPKRGKWILDRSGAYCCSECMEPCATYVMMRPRDKFCKMCGAKMEMME